MQGRVFIQTRSPDGGSHPLSKEQRTFILCNRRNPRLSMESDTTTTELLKKDNIDIEEPYGGYNSLEDFFPPYSSGRKRQEMDEIEKRKIALRGLHNLINNLG